MPFSALYKTNKINALSITNPDWLNLKQSEKKDRLLRCPECEEGMVARAGIDSKICSHFAHNRELIEGEISKCSLRDKDNQKSHKYVQSLVFEICKSLKLKADTEHKIKTPAGNRWADVCVSEKKKIIEVQLSSQSEEDYFERTQNYNDAGYETLWITWKKRIPLLPIAGISIHLGGEILKNKKNIMDAELSLMTFEMYFTEKTHSKYGYEIDTIWTSTSLYRMINAFMFDKARYQTECPICPKPHWHGEKCEELIPKIKRMIREYRIDHIEQRIKANYPETYEYLNDRHADRLEEYMWESSSYLLEKWENFEILIDELKTAEMIKQSEAERKNKEKLKLAELKKNRVAKLINLNVVDENTRIPPSTNQQLIIIKDDFIKHFNGECYRHDLELDLKYTYRPVYEAARIAHENRMFGLKRGIPKICQEFLDVNFKGGILCPTEKRSNLNDPTQSP